MASRTKNVRSQNIDDSLKQPLHKRHKQLSASALTQEEYDILNESPPLGLKLKKSDSFVELLEAVLLSQKNKNKKDDTLNSQSKSKKESRAPAVKLKPSNFEAMYLKIGSWEYKSSKLVVGDLVAKCLYATKKLVWEVLDGNLDRKRKIEIKWADITALKANCPENGHSSLTLVVARKPLFFMEDDLLPGRKNTRWVSTTDFTGGQASTHRMHFLQCEQGLLTKHFEKLIQCSSHLNRLSKQPDIKLDSPYFGTRLAASEKPDNLEDCDLHQVNGKGSAMTRFQNTRSPHSSLSPSFTIEHGYLSPISVPCEAPSSSSEGIYRSEADSRGPSNLDQIKQPGLRHSNSQKIILDNVTHVLLSDDVEVTIASDDSSLISKVNSFGNVLVLDPAEVLNPPLTKTPSLTIKQPGLPHSNSLSYLDFDLIEEMDLGNPSFSVDVDLEITPDNVRHDLLSDDVEVTIASDDSSLISKVNSFGNVLVLDPAEVLNPPLTKTPSLTITQPGLPHSNSLSYLDFDLIEEMDLGNPSFSVDVDLEITPDNVRHDLLSDDVEVTIAFDDSSLISKVNSFSNVLVLDPAEGLNPPDIGPEENIELGDDLESNEGNKIEMDIEVAAEEDSRVVYGGNPTSGMTRNDSFLIVADNLPKIASLPKLPSFTKIPSLNIITPLSSPDDDYACFFSWEGYELF